MKSSIKKFLGGTIDPRLMCPLTKSLFIDPVIASDGHTYERTVIEQWFRRNGTSPFTNEQLHDIFIPNHLVSKQVADVVTLIRAEKPIQHLLLFDDNDDLEDMIAQTQEQLDGRAETVGTGGPLSYTDRVNMGALQSVESESDSETVDLLRTHYIPEPIPPPNASNGPEVEYTQYLTGMRIGPNYYITNISEPLPETYDGAIERWHLYFGGDGSNSSFHFENSTDGAVFFAGDLSGTLEEKRAMYNRILTGEGPYKVVFNILEEGPYDNNSRYLLFGNRNELPSELDLSIFNAEGITFENGNDQFLDVADEEVARDTTIRESYKEILMGPPPYLVVTEDQTFLSFPR